MRRCTQVLACGPYYLHNAINPKLMYQAVKVRPLSRGAFRSLPEPRQTVGVVIVVAQPSNFRQKNSGVTASPLATMPSPLKLTSFPGQVKGAAESSWDRRQTQRQGCRSRANPLLASTAFRTEVVSVNAKQPLYRCRGCSFHSRRIGGWLSPTQVPIAPIRHPQPVREL
jgi:hypothetical protein